MPCPSMYGSKMILDRPNHFGWIQIKKNSPEKSNLNVTKMIWMRSKFFLHVQNNLDGPKLFWTYRRTWHESTKSISVPTFLFTDIPKGTLTNAVKGQLISKCLFEKIVWTKIPTKNLIDSAQQV